MQDSVMLGSKRKIKEDGDNESPETATTGNGPRVQRPTPKNPNGSFPQANSSKSNFEPA